MKAAVKKKKKDTTKFGWKIEDLRILRQVTANLVMHIHGRLKGRMHGTAEDVWSAGIDFRDALDRFFDAVRKGDEAQAELR